MLSKKWMVVLSLSRKACSPSGGWSQQAAQETWKPVCFHASCIASVLGPIQIWRLYFSFGCGLQKVDEPAFPWAEKHQATVLVEQMTVCQGERRTCVHLCVLASFIWVQSLDVFNDSAQIQILEEPFWNLWQHIYLFQESTQSPWWQYRWEAAQER